MKITASDIQEKLHLHIDPEKAQLHKRFFKTGLGEYGEGDTFLGITVPKCRMIAKNFKDAPQSVWIKLLHSQWHEERLTALFIMTHQYQAGDFEKKHDIVDAYLGNLAYVNSWDLVDASAYKILGDWKLLTRTRVGAPILLKKMARCDDLWTRRVAMVCSYAFIREEWLDPTFELAEQLLHDKHDLIHKAVGWMLREAGKKDEDRLKKFLDTHIRDMPRTMVRYAIEKFDEKTYNYYLGL